MTDDTATSVEVECVYDNGCGKPEGECAVTCKAVLDAVANTIGKGRAAAHPLVQGRCPACNGSSLFLGTGGYVTCSRLDCPNPTLADDQLHRGRPDPGAWLAEGTRDLSIPQQTPAFTARPVTPEMERAATERARQAAEEGARSAAWMAQQSSPHPAEVKLARLRDCAASLHSRGIDAMSASFVLDIIDGRRDESARTTANNPPTIKTATQATYEPKEH